MKKIAITTTSFGQYDKSVLLPLEEQGFEIVINPYGRKLNKEEIEEICRDSIGIIAGTEKLDGQTLERLPLLKVISRCGTGMDNVDLDAAKRLNIKVCNTPDAPTVAVAELAIALMLNLMRKVSRMDSGIREGKWEKLMGNLLSGKKAGIIGCGRIGRKVAVLLKCFQCDIAFYDPFVGSEVIDAAKMGLQELLEWADIVSVHVPGSSTTVIGEKEIGYMKHGAWLVNLSRGEAVDEDALYQALKNNSLSGAGLDVFREEPYKGKLKELDNVVMTAHVGSYARESRIEMEQQAVKNLLVELNSTERGII
ncbi:MAG: phosphoglycerate dehydrogenase [Nitrospira sp.]|nr:phosphoglycerate dehydrogenase [Nitrospira sp.]